jgi:predicted  nucleic acid-binding Zn-ribbon protein
MGCVFKWVSKAAFLVMVMAVTILPAAAAQSPSPRPTPFDLPSLGSEALTPPSAASGDSLLDNINQEIRLEKKMERLDRNIKRAQAAIPQYQVAIDQREASLIGINQALAREQREYRSLDRKLTRVTAKFINLTQSIEAGKQRPQDTDGQLFQYMAESDLGDAVLVYQLGSVLLDSQGAALEEVRKVAASAYREQQQVREIREQKNQALAATREDLDQAEDEVADLQQDRESINERLRRLREQSLGGVGGIGQSDNSLFAPDLLDAPRGTRAPKGHPEGKPQTSDPRP